jgi:hypothetical protein
MAIRHSSMFTEFIQITPKIKGKLVQIVDTQDDVKALRWHTKRLRGSVKVKVIPKKNNRNEILYGFYAGVD